MASPRFDGSPEQSALDVHRLESDCGDCESVVMVKLTDEMFAALMQAQRKGLSIRVHIDEQGGKWELGDPANGGRVFRYQQQALPGPPTDAVVHDPRTGTHRAVAAFRSKYQIQATDKSFADTRERAQKLIEEEKSRGTKDVTNLPVLRVPTAMLRYKMAILRQLRRDGLNEEAGIERRVEDIVREVSEPSGSGSTKITLKPSLYGEVDTRWLWYNQEEKAYVRRVTQGLSSSQPKSSSFAPMRKSGMERMQAPTHSSSNSVSSSGQTVSPEVLAFLFLQLTGKTMRDLRCIYEHLEATVCRSYSDTAKFTTSFRCIGADSEDTAAQARSCNCVEWKPGANTDPDVPSANKRKAHVPPASSQQRQNDGKRPRQESASPPEDPTNHPQQNQKLAARSGGSTASSRLSSPCSLSSPTQPSCDWDKNYGEIKNVHEAEKYFALFQQEYPEYLECYRTLNEVAKEFRQLEMQLKNAVDNRKDTTRIEQTIQMRFAHFDKDPEFVKTRQRYADLHSKLAVLKSRISDFERAQDMAANASTSVPMDLCDLE
ncbi:unnamed protein product [Heligmosomoides polygyrus]|uniref:OCEL domain-containing protein n=1 Tax=Heligmosomoides polygyrus TaxID=6339 RepID=A0A183FHF6_HELPZ|nr:unnamed protein product [Heligmosomoides polygyrus]